MVSSALHKTMGCIHKEGSKPKIQLLKISVCRTKNIVCVGWEAQTQRKKFALQNLPVGEDGSSAMNLQFYAYSSWFEEKGSLTF